MTDLRGLGRLYSTFRPWHWLFVPLLAILAYLSVLQIGFLNDDFVLLMQGQAAWDWREVLPRQDWFLYRPVGTLLIWRLEGQWWGFNPFPYHLQGLLFHAATSLLLALWLAEATQKRALGLLAGATFAVFPLHLEAVGWVAAQWDALATLLGMASLYTFTIWWRRGMLWSYLLAVPLYAFALFTKDSMLTFLPMFLLAAWLSTPPMEIVKLRRLAFALIPFCVVLATNLSLRYIAWGNFGGYPDVPNDYASFFWDSLLGYGRALLSPINSKVLGSATAQIVGLVSSVALLAGLIVYGRSQSRLVIASALWIVLALLPVLNLRIETGNLQQNRFLYLAATGYCALLAALLYAALTGLRRWRAYALVGVAAVLLMSAIACWLQLGAWRTATAQVNSIEDELIRLIPPPLIARQEQMTWYAQDSPREYKGACLVHLALGTYRYFRGAGDVPIVKEAEDAEAAPIQTGAKDSFALRFSYSDTETRFHPDYLAGITQGGPPPAAPRPRCARARAGR